MQLFKSIYCSILSHFTSPTLNRKREHEGEIDEGSLPRKRVKTNNYFEDTQKTLLNFKENIICDDQNNIPNFGGKLVANQSSLSKGKEDCRRRELEQFQAQTISKEFSFQSESEIKQEEEENQQQNLKTNNNRLGLLLEQHNRERQEWRNQWQQIKHIAMQVNEEEDKWSDNELDQLEFQISQLKLDINKSSVQSQSSLIEASNKISEKQQQPLQEEIIDEEQDKQVGIQKESPFELFSSPLKPQQQSECEILKEQFRQLYNSKTSQQQRYITILNSQQIQQVHEILVNKDQPSTKEVVVHQHVNYKLTYHNLQTLYSLNWLNDEIINAYCHLIQLQYPSSCIVLNSYFYSQIVSGNKSNNPQSNYNKISRILSKRNITSSSTENILIPININNNHWIFCEVNIQTKHIIYYDSLNHNQSSLLQPLADVFQHVFKDNKSTMINQVANEKVDLKYSISRGQTGKQLNMSDCGVFTLRGMHLRALQADQLQQYVEQSDAQYYRYYIALSLLLGKIIELNHQE